MSSPAYIVDGYQEKKIIQRICPKSPVRILNCNGDGVNLEAAAKRIASLIRLIGSKYFPYIVIFDREGRKQSSDWVREHLRELIKAEGIDDHVIVGVPDRMIENWILSDWENIKLKANLKEPKTNAFEGQHGKCIIQKLLPKEAQYHETIQGVDWFISGSPKKMAAHSNSFNQLMGELIEIQCEWLTKK